MSMLPDFPWEIQVYSNNNTINHILKVLFKPYFEVHLFQICQEIQAFNYKQKDAYICPVVVPKCYTEV